MIIKLNYPKNLYSDVRIEEKFSLQYVNENGDISADSDTCDTGAMIRVFDGEMWYTSSTNEIDKLQEELDSLASLATPNPDIYQIPEIAILEVNKTSQLRFNGDNDYSKLTRNDVKKLVEYYVDRCIDTSIEEINYWNVSSGVSHTVFSFMSSKGAEIEYDMQTGSTSVVYAITVDGVTNYAWKGYNRFSFDELYGHEEEVLKTRDRFLDYAHNAVDIEPGEYRCILAPEATSIFTHESFGHKSEADFMLNDKTLRDEWVMNKKVGSELVSICDEGSELHHGYVPFDAEGTKSRPTWLIKNGILTGRLHDAHSAVTLSEEMTGNSRAQDYSHFPLVRMTNTFMENGTSNPDDMIKDIEDGIYVYEVNSGTGQATFTMRPSICYRIRNGKICEPLRVNVINGTVFQTLFDIEAVGNDFRYMETGYCGKGSQMVIVSMGGPSIKVKKLTFN